VSLEVRVDWPTVENTRRRQVTPYPFVSSKARFVLGSGAGSGSQTQIRMLAGERSEILVKRSPFYTAKIACSKVSDASRFFSLLVFPTWCGAGVSASEMLIGGIRNSSGALVASSNFGAAKNISDAPRRNVLRTGRSSSGCSARNDFGIFASLQLYYDITFIMKIMFVNHILLCQSVLFYSNEKKEHEFFNFFEDRNHS